MIFPQSVIQDRYRADSLLGRGGMGEVWRCFDTILDRPVVLKVVAPELAKSRPQSTGIFIDEARIGGSLAGHPNVVAVYDLINTPQQNGPLLAIVMEYVEGMSAASWIDNAPAGMDAETRYYLNLMIALEASKAVAYAHRGNILHRDIKPLNIFISKYGVTKIGDFGIARYADAVTREHTVWNFRSPGYSAPEQWKNERPAQQTDIYQLGATLYHLFTGQLPFSANSVAALINQHLSETPKPPKDLSPVLSEKLSKLILDSLAKDATDRPGMWAIIDAIAAEVQRQYTLEDANNRTVRHPQSRLCAAAPRLSY